MIWISITQETRKKKLEYNRDLLEQIELKKKETERLKAKEKEDDERLTRKLEEQLKRVMLEEQKEKEKMQRYQSRQVNQSSLVPKLEKDVISRTKRSEGRKALSENGKEDLIAPKKSDKDLYKYFTNSARETQHLRNVRYNPYLGIDDLSTTSPQSSTLNRPVEPHWKRYPAEMEEPIYSTCSHHGHDDKSEAEENSLVCSTCQSQLICRNCDVDFCLKCRKRKKTERNRLTLGTSPRKHNHSLRPRHQALTETTEESEFEQEVDILIHSPIVVKSHSNPFSMNLGKSSVFHPSRKHTDSKISVNFRNGDVFVEQQSSIGANMDEMKRITDEKLSKYAKNYSDLRSRRSRVLDEDTFPMPLIRENTSKMAAATATDNFPMEQNSPAFKTLETKWQVRTPMEAPIKQTPTKISFQIPAVQKNTIAREPTNNTRVLTQVGAFRKQLQLDQLEFDNIPSNL